MSNNTFEKGGFALYPNPASSEVFVRTPSLQYPATVIIADVSGKTLSSQILDAESNAVSIATLQTGLYFVSIKDVKGVSLNSKLTVK